MKFKKQYEDMLRIAYNNCKKFVDDENGLEDITYEDVRGLLGYIDYLQDIVNKLEAGYYNKVADMSVYMCPHGYTNSDECPDCCH